MFDILSKNVFLAKLKISLCGCSTATINAKRAFFLKLHQKLYFETAFIEMTLKSYEEIGQVQNENW
jgi:hypothetical protein